jgi:hypothetical protein
VSNDGYDDISDAGFWLCGSFYGAPNASVNAASDNTMIGEL